MAADVNKENYRTKMEQVMEKKKLTDEDVEALGRVRRLLCVPKDVVDECTMDICGAVYKSAVLSALSVGTESFTPELRDRCKRAKDAVRLTDDMALKILKNEVVKAFMAYIRVARTKQNKIEQSKEIRKMVYFNSTVVTPMVSDVTKAAAEDAAKELAELLKEAQAAAKQEEEDEKKEAEAKAESEEKKEEGEEAKDGEEKKDVEAKADGEKRVRTRRLRRTRRRLRRSPPRSSSQLTRRRSTSRTRSTASPPRASTRTTSCSACRATP